MKFYLRKSFTFNNEHIKKHNLDLSPNKIINGTTVHELCYQPETSEGLESLAKALNEKPKHEHLFKHVHNKLTEKRHGNATKRPNKALDLRLPLYSYDKVFTPLVLASMSGNTKVMKHLIKSQAEIKPIRLCDQNFKKLRGVELFFDNAPLFFAIQSNQFKAFKFLVKDAPLNSTAVHITVKPIDYRAVLRQMDYYNYSYLHFAITTQNKFIVKYLIEQKGMAKDSPCFSPASNLNNGATNAHQLSMFEFLTSQHLKMSFVLWYCDTFNLELSQSDIEKLIDLCGSKQRFEQTLDKLGCQNNVSIQKYLSINNIADRAIRNCIEKLFNLENPSLTRYQKALMDAAKLGVQRKTYPALVSTLHDLPFFNENPAFKNLLNLYLPRPRVSGKPITIAFDAESSSQVSQSLDEEQGIKDLGKKIAKISI